MRTESGPSLSSPASQFIGFCNYIVIINMLTTNSHPENFNNLVNRYKEYFVLDGILIRLMKALIKSFNPRVV